ncbi:MAG: hypothetical protein LQ338_004878 [Usnochroma carphineum]|nr:MAG: hypothetical protein LQ338_004878 [Usnochroma carphineum]
MAILHETLQMLHGTFHWLRRSFHRGRCTFSKILPRNIVSIYPLRISESPNVFPALYTSKPPGWEGAGVPFKYFIASGRGSRAWVSIGLAKAERPGHIGIYVLAVRKGDGVMEYRQENRYPFGVEHLQPDAEQGEQWVDGVVQAKGGECVEVRELTSPR